VVFLFSVANKAGFWSGDIGKFARCLINRYGEAKINELYGQYG